MIRVSIPLRTGAGLNGREHWRTRAKRVKGERTTTAWAMRPHAAPAGAVTVLLRRVSPGTRPMDDDNLPGSLKAVRDQVAAWLGRDDADPSIVWKYAQRRGAPKEWAVELEVA
ncbi:hypothetical protein GCM10007320_08850 [Pseudorhodoferax aquiterrae]|uniref:Uncharacterized protein n=1 Tax=Pseudorhodoferax aquiterrae TaxID=747304 RepID=A0ABQ3FWE8_9BURK|nr:hypothetical protein [Pseudorhodoferax aquiterrae]GHC72757.1 hypothetical protein GCM10007320_08850 [Pseudorhodoferax aquiterrae]